eukprot:g7371.t1
MKCLAWLCGAFVAFSLLAATATSDGGSGDLLGISMTEQRSDSGLKLPGMRWAHGWWLDGTTWVSCSSRDSNCFRVADFDSDTEHGLADLGAGHAHPVIVVENSSAASDADNGSQTVHPQPPKSSWLWNLPWGIPTRAGRVEGHDTSSPRAMVAIATSSTTANKAIVVENSSAASDADNGYQTDLPQPPKRSWLCNFPWGIPTRAGRVEGHNTSSSGAMVAIATSSTTANKLPGTREDLAYWQRFLAVVTLGMACGGLTTVYIFSIFYSSMAVWVYHGSEESYFAGFCLLALVAVYFLHGVPVERFSHPVIKLWRAYFAFSYEVDDGDSAKETKKRDKKSRRGRGGGSGRKAPSRGERKRRRRETTSRTYMIAQIPHGIVPFGSILGVGVLPDVFDGLSSIGGVVANALLMTPLLRRAVNWLGVRRASSAGIVQMFKDGIQAVGVVTGGIHEMFVSQQKERIIAPRPNFARLALQGGHDIVLVFVYGVSRTQKCAFALPALSRKYGVPLLMGYGAFLLIPFRETLHMVVSKPIAVGKVADPTDQQVKVVQKRVEMELCRLYYEHRPQWETRQLELLRGAASPQELELAREQASAVDRRL